MEKSQSHNLQIAGNVTPTSPSLRAVGLGFVADMQFVTSSLLDSWNDRGKASFLEVYFVVGWFGFCVVAFAHLFLPCFVADSLG